MPRFSRVLPWAAVGAGIVIVSAGALWLANGARQAVTNTIRNPRPLANFALTAGALALTLYAGCNYLNSHYRRENTPYNKGSMLFTHDEPIERVPQGYMAEIFHDKNDDKKRGFFSRIGNMI